MIHALEALRHHARTLSVVVNAGALDRSAVDRLIAVADDVSWSREQHFAPSVYAAAVARMSAAEPGLDEIVLTGDRWFGPVGDLGPVLARMDATDADFWEMVENPRELPEAFPDEGFPHELAPWRWTAVRRRLFTSDAWTEYWGRRRAHHDQLEQERAFSEAFRARGFSGAAAFARSGYASSEPALFDALALIADGCPFVDRAVFASYPPFLDRFAVIGEEIAAAMAERGYPLDLMRQSLARSVPPKALNANCAMLDVLSDTSRAYDQERPFRIAVVVHATELTGMGEILRRLEHLPSPADIYVTTTEGMSAGTLERLLESWAARNAHSYELRVTPASPGRDMSDFFVGCRDVLLSDRYDLVVKLHSRPAPRKTMNVRRYFRRYQLDNLLNSPGYTENVLGLFQAEPGLGVVFPPMMHIGYGTMGKGWAGLRAAAERLCAELGISVPLDGGSPLAPYGGMWIARPQALRRLAERKWTFADYGHRGRRSYGDLAHLQERLIAYSAGEAGYHARTVLTFEHAQISHTALDFKVDQLFSTTRGWPVEQIRMLHRAGYPGYGGTVALARMYMRLNHPRVVRSLSPVYRLAYRAFALSAPARRALARLRDRRGGSGS